MSSRCYSVLIWIMCTVCWCVVWLPAAIHLSLNWYRGRNRVFKQLCPKQIQLYYHYFAPHALVENMRSGASVTRFFEMSFAHIYGRRRYVVPLSLLALVSAVGFSAIAFTLQKWENVTSFFGSATSDPKALPPIAVAAFFGAFTWIVVDQVGRVRSGDLTQHDVAICVLRLLIAIPFGYTFAFFAVEPLGVPLAFLVGTFPTGTLLKSAQRFASQRLQLGEPETSDGPELESLQSVGRTQAERFMEEGVCTIAQLVNSDPVDLAIRMNQPFDYIVDCAAQALVWIHFTGEIKGLAKYSLRSAYEVHWLVDRLSQGTDEEKKRALVVVTEAATRLDMTADALRSTMERINEAPYSRFLFEFNDPAGGFATHEVPARLKAPAAEERSAA